ncbi:hypothetical protein BSL78_25112 [Apostichopus japonicus]|uniref:Ig-like domain-containing protein n=1 Tax=Stichopus japonicus TaxID=307972 RepID=A0A2G8JQJ4_STIJA|nr:hypothetical protein BSL78_25112 [Apostichopus japonicus]
MDGFIVSKFLHIAIFLVLYACNVIGCNYHCTEGQTVNSKECYAMLACDFSFPDITVNTDHIKVDIYSRYIYGLRVAMNFTGRTNGNVPSKGTYSYNGIQRRQNQTVNRYLFQVKVEYIEEDLSYFYWPEVTKVDFSFSILNLQRRDAGTYHLSLTDDNSPYTLYSHHTYILFTVYQPPTPLVCQGPSSSPSVSYRVSISCSITNGFPPINLEMIKPYGCDFQKHYTDENGIQELSVDITSCDENSTVGCIATRKRWRSFPQRIRTDVNLTSLKVIQPPTEALQSTSLPESTPLVCEGPSSSPSAAYHVVLSCSITDGYPPINLEVIKPDGCDYQKHYTDNNGTKELSVYVTSCNQNSTIGCIATQEPLESKTTSQYDDRCEFSISRTDQEWDDWVVPFGRDAFDPAGRVM